MTFTCDALLRTLLGVAVLFGVVGCNPAGSAGNQGGTGGESAPGAAGISGTLMEPLPTLVSAGHYRVSLPQGAFVSGGAGGTTVSGNGGGAATDGAASNGAGGTSGGANGPVCNPIAPPGPPPFVAFCGDGFRTGFEQCDDGNELNGDACSPDCRVTPSLVAPRSVPNPAPSLPLPPRQLGSSRHPLAAGCNALGISMIDHSSNPPTLKLATFSNVGVAGPVVEYGSANVDDAAPAVAAFPDDTFAVAWTDFDGDGDELGIQLRKVDPAALLQAPSVIANSGPAFSQRAPDAIFDGNELVVAWVDDSDPVSAPDIRYRLFDQNLTPKTGDLTLAATGAVEEGLALAAFAGSWAAAWRSDNAGNEAIEVQSGATHWTVGPFLPGGIDDRPALAFVDATHLAVAFTEGTDPTSSGIANVPRLYAAVLDAAFPGSTLAFPVTPTVEPYASTPTLSQSEPALTRFTDRLLLAWRSAAVPGDALGEELWSRQIKWSANNGLVQIDTSAAEMPLSESAMLHKGDQRRPTLLSSALWPEHRVVSLWEDFGQTFGAASGAPDVGVQFAEAPRVDTSVMWTTNYVFGNTSYGFSSAQLATTGTNTAAASIVLTSPFPAAAVAVFSTAFSPSGDMWVAYYSGNAEAQVLMRFGSEKVASSGSPTADVRLVLPFLDTSYGAPDTLAFDASGNLWVGFYYGHVLRFGSDQLAVSGAPVPQVTLTSPSFDGITDMLFDRDQNLLVAAWRSGVVARLAPEQLIADNPALVPAVLLNVPGVDGLALGPRGDLWAADYDRSRVLEFSAGDLTTSKTPIPKITLTGIAGPEPLAFDRSGNLWVGSYDGNKVLGFAPSDIITSGAKAPRTVLTGNNALSRPNSIRFQPGIP